MRRELCRALFTQYTVIAVANMELSMLALGRAEVVEAARLSRKAGLAAAIAAVIGQKLREGEGNPEVQP